MTNPFISILNMGQGLLSQNLQQQVLNNPRYPAVMEMIRNNGGDARQLFYRIAQEKGIDANAFLNQLKQQLPR